MASKLMVCHWCSVLRCRCHVQQVLIRMRNQDRRWPKYKSCGSWVTACRAGREDPTAIPFASCERVRRWRSLGRRFEERKTWKMEKPKWRRFKKQKKMKGYESNVKEKCQMKEVKNMKLLEVQNRKLQKKELKALKEGCPWSSTAIQTVTPWDWKKTYGMLRSSLMFTSVPSTLHVSFSVLQAQLSQQLQCHQILMRTPSGFIAVP